MMEEQQCNVLNKILNEKHMKNSHEVVMKHTINFTSDKNNQ